MEDWKYEGHGHRFKEFNTERTQTWIEQGFTQTEAIEWIEESKIRPVYLISHFAIWLRDEKNIDLFRWKYLFLDKKKELNSQYGTYLRENKLAYCDHCWKMLENNLMFLNNWEENLSFCSADCQMRWNGSKIVDAKKWLDFWYPKDGISLDKRLYWNSELKKDDNNFGKRRSEITKFCFDLDGENITGILDMTDFVNLEELICWNNQLIRLEIRNCLKLKNLGCQGNKLTELILPANNQLTKLNCSNNLLTEFNFSALNTEILTFFGLSDNNLHPIDIVVFSKFVNLEKLFISNHNKMQTEVGIYSRFYGSLVSFKDLTKLDMLEISNTDIDKGIEYLPESLRWFSFSSELRTDAKVQEIENLLMNQLKEGENYDKYNWKTYWNILMKKSSVSNNNLEESRIQIVEKSCCLWNFS